MGVSSKGGDSLKRLDQRLGSRSITRRILSLSKYEQRDAGTNALDAKDGGNQSTETSQWCAGAVEDSSVRGGAAAAAAGRRSRRTAASCRRVGVWLGLVRDTGVDTLDHTVRVSFVKQVADGRVGRRRLNVGATTDIGKGGHRDARSMLEKRDILATNGCEL